MTAPAGVRGDSRSSAQPRFVDAPRAIALARNVLDTEARAIVSLAARLGAPFASAVGLMLRCKGRVVVSGIGKSGHVARKIAATLSSTASKGTPFQTVSNSRDRPARGSGHPLLPHATRHL